MDFFKSNSSNDASRLQVYISGFFNFNCDMQVNSNCLTKLFVKELNDESKGICERMSIASKIDAYSRKVETANLIIKTREEMDSIYGIN
jgi:hypothetical protein